MNDGFVEKNECVTIDGVRDEEIFFCQITSDIVKKIAYSFSKWIKKYQKIEFDKQTIAIGHDVRNTSLKFKNILISTFSSIGVNVIDCSMATTPAIGMSSKFFSCNASVMITASHLPWQYNGFKLYTRDASSLQEDDIAKILNYANIFNILEFTKEHENKFGTVRKIDLMGKYVSFIKEIITKTFPYDEPLKNLKIVVDASGGCGGFFAIEVLKTLGADIDGSVLLDPDPFFDKHVPNPENNEAIEFAKKSMISANADLAILFDTDVDRVALIDSDGTLFNKDALIALCAAIVLRKEPGSVIVTDSVVSDYLVEFIEHDLKGFVFKYKRGYSNVINAAKKIIKSGMPCHLAIETSGHAAFSENSFIDDGAYLAVIIIIELVKLKKEKKSLRDLIKNLKTLKISNEIRINYDLKYHKNSDLFFEKFRKEYHKINIGSKIIYELDDKNLEGIRFRFYLSNIYTGWVLIRKSIHEDLFVIKIECDSEIIYNEVKEKILNLIREIDKITLDLS